MMICLGVAGLGAGCSTSDGSGDVVTVNFNSDVVPLTALEVTTIIRRAVAAINNPNMHVVVVDRRGMPLGAFTTVVPPVPRDEDNIALSLARTTAFFSNSQAPLSSRTVQTLSTFHFPPTFGAPFLASVCPASTGAVVGSLCEFTAIAPQQTTTGVRGTPPGPLWQINATNRGALISAALTPQFPPSRNLDGSFPSPGITLLPGGIPLYKANAAGVPRLVGGIGVFIRPNANTDPDLAGAEFAAIKGASGAGTAADPNFFNNIDPQGAVYLLGLLLPYVQQITLPAGAVAGADPGPPPAAGWLDIDPLTAGAQVFPIPGVVDPFGFLLGPIASPTPGGLTVAEVRTIIQQCVTTANRTKAAIRFPLGSSAVIIAVVTDLNGVILAHFRMEDSLTDAVDVVPAKARSTVYYSRPGGPAPADRWPGFPVRATGVAITTRTLGFLSQPFYPPGIEGTAPGPLFALAQLNQRPDQATRLGRELPVTPNQNGLTFFPGSVPLYRNGVLVGGLGVSGDGVEQNDFIAAGGGVGFEPPPELRIDNFSFDGVELPYLKFPPNPTLTR